MVEGGDRLGYRKMPYFKRPLHNNVQTPQPVMPLGRFLHEVSVTLMLLDQLQGSLLAKQYPTAQRAGQA